MTKMTWQRTTIPNNDAFVAELNKAIDEKGKPPLHPIAIHHLLTIGIQTIEDAMAFLYPSSKHLHSPWMMRDISKTVERLDQAIRQGESICIVGDYDVDGTTATYIAYQAIKMAIEQLDMVTPIHYIVPHRGKNGYGIKSPIVDQAHQLGAKVIVTVDNGINANDPIDYANHLGMTVLVTDHHLPGDVLPNAYALVNPNRTDCPYPFKGICGSVVAYKVAQALYEKLGLDLDLLHAFDEHVAIATIADVMPLRDENRYLVRRGLRKMSEEPSLPIKALLKAMKQSPSTVNEETVGFFIGPAINAVGRVDDAELAVQWYLSSTPLEAAVRSAVLIDYNEQRKSLLEEAMLQVQVHPTDPVQVVVMEAQEGIVGIIAGQIRETTGCPTFVLTKTHTPGVVKGSARSGSEFPVHEALKRISEEYPDWFVSWGGHGGAAGVAMYDQYVDDFRNALNDLFVELALEPEIPTYLSRINEKFLPLISKSLDRLYPFGQGNPRPVFQVDTTITEANVFGPKQNHLRLKSTSGMEFTWFRGANEAINYPSGEHQRKLFLTVGKGMFRGQLNALIKTAE